VARGQRARPDLQLADFPLHHDEDHDASNGRSRPDPAGPPTGYLTFVDLPLRLVDDQLQRFSPTDTMR